MRKLTLILFAVCATGVIVGAIFANPRQIQDAREAFWSQFRTAVIKMDKAAVARYVRFPLAMPYGMPAIKNKAQLIARYRKVFNGETNAARCFGTAEPERDAENRNVFTVACKNAAGDEVVVYHFSKIGQSWKFTGLDNLNE